MDTPQYTNEDMMDHDAVFAVIKDAEGKILLQEHIKYSHRTLPWGKVKQGQSLIEGLKQEIKDECNISIWDSKEIISWEYTYNRNNKDVHVMEHIYEIIDFTGEIQNNEPHKHGQIVFKSIDEILKLPHLSHVAVVYLQTLGITRKYKI